MATGALRGDGLFAAHNALHALATEPQRIDRARARFDRSPPPPYSNPESHNSTRSPTPEAPGDEQRRLTDLSWELRNERDASRPYAQFEAQARREYNWLIEASERRIKPLPLNRDIFRLAKDEVVKDWKKQRIWNDQWETGTNFVQLSLDEIWNHEEADMPGPTRGVEVHPRPSDARTGTGLTSLEETESANRFGGPTRPVHQFIHRLLLEADRLIKLEGVSGDIYTRAYTVVRDFWTKHNIWDKRWGVMPGLSWKHELPFEEELTSRLEGSQAYPAMDYGDDRPNTALPATNIRDVVWRGGVPYDQRTGMPAPEFIEERNRALDRAAGAGDHSQPPQGLWSDTANSRPSAPHPPAQSARTGLFSPPGERSARPNPLSVIAEEATQADTTFGTRNGLARAGIFGARDGPAQAGTIFGTRDGHAQAGTIFGARNGPAQAGTIFGTRDGHAQAGTIFGARNGPAQAGTIFGTRDGPAQADTFSATGEGAVPPDRLSDEFGSGVSHTEGQGQPSTGPLKQRASARRRTTKPLPVTAPQHSSQLHQTKGTRKTAQVTTSPPRRSARLQAKSPPNAGVSKPKNGGKVKRGTRRK